MKHILFVVPAFFENRPQAIRFRNLVEHFSCDNSLNVYVLFPSRIKEKREYLLNKINIIEIPAIPIIPNLNPYYYPKTHKKSFPPLAFVYKILGFLLKLIVFPDLFLFEFQRIRKEITKLHTIYSFDCIVGSAKPFSLMLLGKTIKKLLPGKNPIWIFDVGDPLYNNSAKNRNTLKNLCSKKFEATHLKYVDYLVVTNSPTKFQYARSFFKSISEEKIHIIPMGGSLIYKKNINSDFNNNKKALKLIYAGIFYKKLREPYNLFNAIINNNKNNTAKFTLDIYGPGMDSYKKRVSANSNSINFKGSITHSDLLLVYNNYDLIVHIDNAYGLQSPGKDFEILMPNKPIIFIYSNELSITYKLYRDIKGIFITKNDANAILNLLSEIPGMSFSTNREYNDLYQYSWISRAEMYRTLFD